MALEIALFVSIIGTGRIERDDARSGCTANAASLLFSGGWRKMDVRTGRCGIGFAEAGLIHGAVSVTSGSVENAKGVGTIMRGFVSRSVVALAVLLSAGFLCLTGRTAGAQATTNETAAAQPAAPSAAELAQWQQDLAAWRAEREREISAPDGWLALAGLEWLKPGINTIGAGADNRIRLPEQAPEHLGLMTVSGESMSGAAGKSGAAGTASS